ncbi:unnamed protein product [Ilex paraguariensis]|uniref:Uncharacterized protein n=1 Tax=Ilex paraguariensis TaxID=185542 RepID=A0ABC8RPI5_9AQUA
MQGVFTKLPSLFSYFLCRGYAEKYSGVNECGEAYQRECGKPSPGKNPLFSCFNCLLSELFSFLAANCLVLWLQKYRQFLKRTRDAESQQDNMVAALGSADSACLHMSSLSGLGDLHTVAGSGQFENAAFISFSSSSVLGRLNTPADLGISAIGQLSLTQSSRNPVNDWANFHAVTKTGNQDENVLQGMPLSIGSDQLQHSKVVSQIGELNSANNDSVVFPISNGSIDMQTNAGSSRYSLVGIPNNPITLRGHLQDNQMREAFGNQSSVVEASLDSRLHSPLLDFGRCNENWPNAVQSSEIKTDAFMLRQGLKQATPSDSRGNISSMTMHMMINPQNVSYITSVLPDTGTDLRSQAEHISSSASQNMDFGLKQGWDDPIQDAIHHSYLTCSPMNSSFSPLDVVLPYIQRSDPMNKTFNINDDCNMIGQSNGLDRSVMQHNEVAQLAVQTTPIVKQGNLKEQRKPQGRNACGIVGSLDDLVSAVMV